MLSAYFEAHRGGIEIVAGKLAREFKKHGHALTWIASGPELPPKNAGQALQLRALNITERFGVPFPLPLPSVYKPLNAKLGNVDVVVIHDAVYPLHVLAYLRGRAHGTPVIVVQHIGNVPYRNILLRALMKLATALVTKPILRRADQVVFISDAVAREFGDLTYRQRPKVIFNGVDTAVFKPPISARAKTRNRKPFGLPARTPVALFVGRFVEKKGLAILERLARTRPDVTFALAGWGPVDPRSWQLPNVVVFDGLKGASLTKLYNAADMLILPSVGEGYPLVIQEALACGLPVICGSETAEAHAAAKPFLYPVHIQPGWPAVTATAISSEIEHALGEPDSAADRRAAFARRHYNWERAADSYDALFRKVVRPWTGPGLKTQARYMMDNAV